MVLSDVNCQLSDTECQYNPFYNNDEYKKKAAEFIGGTYNTPPIKK